MRVMAIAVVAAFAVGAISTADAAPRKSKRQYVEPAPVYVPATTYVMHRDEYGRTRTKILVQKRSYLDGGTEVMPGDISGTNRDEPDQQLLVQSVVARRCRTQLSCRPADPRSVLPAGQEQPVFQLSQLWKRHSGADRRSEPGIQTCVVNLSLDFAASHASRAPRNDAWKF